MRIKKAQVDRLLARYGDQKPKPMIRTAGEVRFIKDKDYGKNEWAWDSEKPHQRDQIIGFTYDPKNLKPLAETLKSALAALGYCELAYSTFNRIQSSTISPDGNLGGLGYIMKISEIRRNLMNATEVLSSITDTVYDELHAPHWKPAVKSQSDKDKKEVKEVLNDAKAIKSDPYGWALKDNEIEVEEGPISEDQDEEDIPEPQNKTAMMRVARRYFSQKG